MSLPTLPEPDFIDRDGTVVTSDMVTQYETIAGKALYPAQPERVMVDVIAYRESLLRIAIQGAAEQNLLAFAKPPVLDYLGELVGVTRLAAAPAMCTICFTLSAVLTTDLGIPAGTRVGSSDNTQVFDTTANAVISAGTFSVSVAAQAETAGSAGNGFVAGQINQLLSTISDIAASSISAANTDTSASGLDAELDDHLRERIFLAPEGFAAAGPAGAYRFWAMSAHADIIDAAVLSPTPGLVAVFPLTASGVISQELLDLVLATLDENTRRPITDQVVVLAPSPMPYSIQADVTLLSSADADTVLALVQTQLSTYAANLQAQLASEVIPAQIVNLVMNCAGVNNVVLQSPQFTALNANQFASATAITVTLAGWSNG
jgi:phage-related baseplate assembly protein